MRFVWIGVGVLRPPKLTAFRKRGLNLGRECLSGEVTTDKRSTRLSRATMRHPCSQNLEHDCFSGYFDVHDISHILNDCFVRRQSNFFGNELLQKVFLAAITWQCNYKLSQTACSHFATKEKGSMMRIFRVCPHH